MSASRHTVIVGGGGIGSAIAYFVATMAEARDRVTVVERDPPIESLPRACQPVPFGSSSQLQ